MKTHRLFPRLRPTLAFLALSMVAIPVASARTAFSKVVVFGDSLSDSGNLVTLTGGVFPNAPTYVYGRESNGPVWVEYLAARLGLSGAIANYAVGGAMTRPAPGFPTGNVYSDIFPGLDGTDVGSQIQDYLVDSGGVADPNALFILEGGANDFPRVANPAVIVSNLVESLGVLESSGARHIILVNLPDLGKTPRVILGEMAGQLPEGTAASLTAAIAQLNQSLAAAATAVTPDGVLLTIADVYGLMEILTEDPSAFGLVETQLPYLVYGNNADPDTWMFWDDLHPTTFIHQVFAEDTLHQLLATFSSRKGNGWGAGTINGLRGLVLSGAQH